MEHRQLQSEREVCRSLDLILHVEVNGKEQALSSQFLPALCVSHTNTHKCTNVLTCSLLFLASFFFSFFLILPFSFYQLFCLIKLKVFVISES